MSKSFLTLVQAYHKLGLTGGSTAWIRKSNLLTTKKCDTTKLTKYGNNDFVIDDDIILSNPLEELLHFEGRHNGDYPSNGMALSPTFNLSRPFEITGYVIFHGVGVGDCSSAFVIYHSNKLENYLLFNLELWSERSPYDVNNNIKNSAYVWTGIAHAPGNIGTTYIFSFKYDGKTLIRDIGGTHKEEIVQLANYEADRIMFCGNPLWGARSGDVTVNITIKHQPK